jgi:hypothetical protein
MDVSVNAKLETALSRATLRNNNLRMLALFNKRACLEKKKGLGLGVDLFTRSRSGEPSAKRENSYGR